MTDLPSAIQGDTLPTPTYGAPVRLAISSWLSRPSYTDLPRYWTWYRDVVLASTVEMEAMWAGALARVASKFAAHGYVLKDSGKSARKIAASQELLTHADGGAGWVPFAQKLVQDLTTTDNGVFIRIYRAGEETQQVRVKAALTISRQGYDAQPIQTVGVSRVPSGGRILGMYHLDSLRCTRTGNMAYPVRYQTLDGHIQLLRYDQVLMYADMPSPRAELFGVGRCAAGRAYPTIAKVAAMERLVFESLTGGGAHKIALIRGLMDQTLKGIIQGAQTEAAAKNMIYYLGTILGAIPGDTSLEVVEIRLKELLAQFDPKIERDNAYLIYANNIGVPVQDIQPLSGQGLGTGKQTELLHDAGQGMGALAGFVKWWEQTVSTRVLPATTTLEFRDEHDLRDQEQRASVAKLRADERNVRIQAGEISPAVARQLAADVGDLPPELLQADATPAGTLADDAKPVDTRANPVAAALIQGEPTAPPKAPTTPATKAAGEADDAAALLARELVAAQTLGREARRHA